MFLLEVYLTYTYIHTYECMQNLNEVYRLARNANIGFDSLL